MCMCLCVCKCPNSVRSFASKTTTENTKNATNLIDAMGLWRRMRTWVNKCGTHNADTVLVAKLYNQYCQFMRRNSIRTNESVDRPQGNRKLCQKSFDTTFMAISVCLLAAVAVEVASSSFIVKWTISPNTEMSDFEHVKNYSRHSSV